MLGRGPGAFVTAWNPGSRLQPLGRNRRMNRALAEWLRGVPHWLGAGAGRGWREEHYLVKADPRRVLVLARRFRQRGIVVVAAPRPSRIVLLPPGSPAYAPRSASWPVRPSGRRPARRAGPPDPRS
ncbi:MAG: DUF3293 domain-containing protein [Acetobacteraceae bacterium]|nr:DUF3293 domain-containing protein [Acetobacteraceae bacterium]